MFGENPYEENADGTLTKKEVEPYFRGYTDETGHFSGNLTMPSLVTEVWLSSDAIGSVGTAHLKVSGNPDRFRPERVYRAACRIESDDRERLHVSGRLQSIVRMDGCVRNVA